MTGGRPAGPPGGAPSQRPPTVRAAQNTPPSTPSAPPGVLPDAPSGSAEDDGTRGPVRSALAGLSTRGRSFVAAGLAAAVCAYLLGQPGLLRIGLLLAVLPLVCVAAVYRTRHRVAGSRLLSPHQVPAAAEARVRLRIDNVSRLPTGLLMLQDRVPYVLGPRPRFVVDRVEPGGHREVSYRVRSDLRGRYPLGPLQLRLGDPFGMCELTRPFRGQDVLTVTPRVEPLPPVRLVGETPGFGDGHNRSLALAGEDDVIPRGYRHGDDLRRVHWRSTARHGELMVRREEQPQRAHCTVLLDTRSIGYQGAGPDAPFEWAVSAASSAAVHLLGRGYAVRLLTDTGHSLPGADGGHDSGVGGGWSAPGSAETASLLLDTLAVLDHSDGASLSRACDVLRGGSDGLLVAFLGELDDDQVRLLASARRRTAGAVAFVLDGTAWAQGAGAASAPLASRLGLLREAGWTVFPVPPGVSLGELWRLASAPAGASAGRRAGPAGERPASGGRPPFPAPSPPPGPPRPAGTPLGGAPARTGAGGVGFGPPPAGFGPPPPTPPTVLPGPTGPSDAEGAR